MSFEPSRSASKVLYFLTMAAASSILQGQESKFLQSYACLRNWQDRVEIYIDGGIRGSTDIIKALCLGAKGVGIGLRILGVQNSSFESNFELRDTS